MPTPNLGLNGVANIPNVLAQVGTYYNSVTDSTMPLPVNAPATGNDPNQKPPALSSLWNTVYSDTATAVSTAGQMATTVGQDIVDVGVGAYDSTKSAVASAENAVGSVVGGVQTSLMKWGFILVGVALLGVFVIGKSGVVGQASGFGRP